MTQKPASLFDWNIVGPAIWDAFKKLNPRLMVKNPVMFVTMVGAALTTVGIFTADPGLHSFVTQLAIWLWFTVLFANFAEAVAEGRGKAQAASLRKARKDTIARRLWNGREQQVPAPALQKGDLVVCEAGDIIPADGDVVEGIASVDEAAITGESAPVIRESGGDRSAVTGGTRVLSDRIVIRVTADKGSGFLDKMIALVEGARRQKTPNEIALTILLAALTFIFLLVCVTLKPFGIYSATNFSVPVLVSLLVCLIPTTIGGLLSAIGIAGMDRVLQRNVLAMSGRAVEAAGDVDVLLLDKTGTITLGNRMAVGFHPAPGVSPDDLAASAQLSSLADETPEGRSIVVLAKEKFGLRAREMHELEATFVPFTAQTRMSGVDLHANGAEPKMRIRKGAADAVRGFIESAGGIFPQPVTKTVDEISHRGGTPLVVASDMLTLGTIELKDVVKGGIKERFAQLRKMGIKTVMITGDNPLTAAAIAAEAGVDDFMAQATPEQKLKRIRQEQVRGSPGCHDRRRHERRTGAGAGGRGCCHEHRHASRARSRQHGRSRFQSNEAARHRRDRKTDADYARFAHHLQHRERRSEILRNRPGDADDHVSRDRAAQHHALEHLHQRDPERRHFQRAHHHRAYSAGAARRRLQTDGRARDLATQPADLRLRRSHRSVYRNQADRSDHHRASPGLTNETILLPYSRRSRIDACPGSSLLRSVSAHRLRNFAAVVSRPGQRQFDYQCRRERPRLEIVRPGVL